MPLGLSGFGGGYYFDEHSYLFCLLFRTSKSAKTHSAVGERKQNLYFGCILLWRMYCNRESFDTGTSLSHLQVKRFFYLPSPSLQLSYRVKSNPTSSTPPLERHFPTAKAIKTKFSGKSVTLSYPVQRCVFLNKMPHVVPSDGAKVQIRESSLGGGAPLFHYLEAKAYFAAQGGHCTV